MPAHLQIPDILSLLLVTCHHERANTFHPALHGGFHQGGEAVAVSPLDIQPRVVVEQVVRDCDVALKSRWVNCGHRSQYTV